MDDRALEMERHPKWKKFLYGAAFICLMLAGFLAVFRLRSDPPETAQNPLGDVVPQILIEDTLYYWSEISREYTGADTPGTRVSASAESGSSLPEGFSEYGAFLATVAETPAAQLQMQADFAAFGTVYRNPQTPEVVYIRMTTDWFENQYVRFASRRIFDGDRIAWKGNQYCAPFRKGTDAPLEALPEGAVSVGVLDFIGQDHLPQEDLQTNCISDDIGMSLEGREVFADPNDPEHIYVYSSHLSSGGGYYKCPVWTESYALQYVE